MTKATYEQVVDFINFVNHIKKSKCEIGELIIDKYLESSQEVSKPHFERLTFKERNGHFGLCGMNETNEEQKITDAVYRLMKYEETGLSPEQITTLQKNQKFKYISLDSLSRQDTQTVLIISKKTNELIGSFPAYLIIEKVCAFVKTPDSYEFVIYQSPCKRKLKNKALKGGA